MIDPPKRIFHVLTKVTHRKDQELRVAREQAPGYYNDPDFLIADEPNLTLEEKRSQFALWASLSAPLIISAYVPDLPDEAISYLTNKDFIDVDQDKLGLQATLVSHDETWDVLSKSLANGDRLVTILNNGSCTDTIEVPLARLGWPHSESHRGWKLEVKDLWTGKMSSLDPSADSAAIKATVASHATAAYRISAARKGHWARNLPANGISWVPTGLIFNADSFNCLTSHDNKLGWSTCDGADGQVWQAGKNGGNIKPLSNPKSCLVESHGKAVLGQCSSSGKWQYDRSGNIRRTGSKACLTEGASGSQLSRAADD